MKTFKQIREDAARHKQAAKDHYYGAHLMKKYGDDDHHDSMSDHGSAGKAHRTAAAMSRKHGNNSPQYKQAAKAAKTASKDALSSDGHHDMKRSEPRYHDSMNDLKKSLKKPKPKPVGEATVNELSKKTLGSYVKKAGQSHANIITKASNKQGTVKYGSDAEKRNDKRFDKADRRAKGLNRAIGKLVNKEGSLDELSRKTMGSYLKKAIGHDGYDEKPNLGNIKQASSMKDKDRKDSLLGTQYFSSPKTGKSKLTHDMLKRMKANRKKGIATAVKKLQK